MIKYLYFDAANTLIYKPLLIPKIQEVLNSYNLKVSEEKLIKEHKFLSEEISFPDRTNESFYIKFNKLLLEKLSLIANEKIAKEIFYNCKNLPWYVYPDVKNLNQLNLPIGIISNFNSQLNNLLNSLVKFKFDKIIISEEQKFRKPEKDFYKLAIEKSGYDPCKILYIGDSIKLDIEPTRLLGIKSYLIDRENLYTDYEFRINSLSQISSLIENEK